MEKLGKRGQATVFIILGLVIVIGAIGISYIQNEEFKSKVQNLVFGQQVVPEQARSVVNYADSCLRDLTLEGLAKIGRTGGYIEVPGNLVSNQYLQILTLRIPYWEYGVNNENRRSIDDIEFELKNYIDSNYESFCDFDQFANEGFEFNLEDVDSFVQVGEDDVKVNLNSNFDVSIRDNVYDVNDHLSVKIDVALGKMINIANGMLNRDNNIESAQNPIEANTLNLISAWSTDKKEIPPIAGMDLKCGGRTWSFSENRDKVITGLSDYTPSLKIQGSANERDLTGNPEFGEFYRSMIIDRVYGGNMKDITAGFEFYPDWGYYFDIQPRKGDKLQVGGFNIDAPLYGLLCLNFYNFRYTLKYPLLITLEDENGYTFRFPMEVFLEGNDAEENRFGSYVTPTVSNQDNGFGDENNWQSEIVTISTYNSLNGNALEEVKIGYNCGPWGAAIGETDEEGFYESRFPVCGGGELVLKKEGYGDYRGSFDTLNVGSRSLDIPLEPFKELNVEVIVYDLDEEGEIINERGLRESESVDIEFTKINEDSSNVNYREFVSVDNTEDYFVDLTSGEFNLDIWMNLNREIVLPDENVEGVLYEGEVLDGFVIGGNVYKGFVIDDVSNADKITVHVGSYGEPTNREDVNRNLNREDLEFEPNVI